MNPLQTKVAFWLRSMDKKTCWLSGCVCHVWERWANRMSAGVMGCDRMAQTALSAWPCAAVWVPVWNEAQMQNALQIRVAFTTVFKINAKMRITGDDEVAKDKPAWQGWGVIIGKVKPSSLDFPLCCNELHSWSFRHSRHPCTHKGLRKLPIIAVQLWSLSHLHVLNSHSACFSTVGLLFLSLSQKQNKFICMRGLLVSCC